VDDDVLSLDVASDLARDLDRALVDQDAELVRRGEAVEREAAGGAPVTSLPLST
jgi:hypothetical protein